MPLLPQTRAHGSAQVHWVVRNPRLAIHAHTDRAQADATGQGGSRDRRPRRSGCKGWRMGMGR